MAYGIPWEQNLWDKTSPFHQSWVLGSSFIHPRSVEDFHYIAIYIAVYNKGSSNNLYGFTNPNNVRISADLSTHPLIRTLVTMKIRTPIDFC